jgi:hypothetical protein
VVLINPHPSTPTSISLRQLLYHLNVLHISDVKKTFQPTYKDSFIGTYISLSEAVKFTLYNFYSPGHPKSLASLLDDFRPSLPCILLGDFNAHHEWWYGQLAVSTRKIRAFHAHRGFSKIIVDLLGDNNSTLHNTPGVRTHFPRQKDHQSTAIDLCFSAGMISQYIHTWTINPDSGSDHANVGIILTIQITNN